jgi:hypothetical protein
MLTIEFPDGCDETVDWFSVRLILTVSITGEAIVSSSVSPFLKVENSTYETRN